MSRQKVKLVLIVFSEKTVAALKMREKDETAEFVETVLKMWKAVNIKNTALHIPLADDDRRLMTSFTSHDDDRLSFLQSLAHSFIHMAGGRGSSRVHSLTSETRQAIFSTLMGTVELIKKLLSSGFQYVLTAKFQSDDLEGEFGVYHQLSGGVYFVGVEQVLSSGTLRTRQMMRDLSETDILTHCRKSCCQTPLTDVELDIIDQIVQQHEYNMSSNEKLALYYICGYISKKENLPCASSVYEEAEFTSLVSRGFLSHPSEELFYLSSILY